MPNMSNKNFPHAHGSGRVFAAFSLSHLAGTPGSFDASYLPGATELLTKPPAFTDPLLPIAHPFPGVITSGPTLTFNIQRQPYNATSLGVFVTGSGTRRLPYREALGLFVPASLSPSLAEAWPNNDLYPFALVDETKVGSTHGQVVCGVVPVEPEGEDLDQLAYYEVGLNWELPPYRFEVDFAAGVDVLSSNWENEAIASFQRALERTFWVTASLSANALSEYHPDIEWVNGVQTQNSVGGPVNGSISIGSLSGGDSYYTAPYGALTSPSLSPSGFPWGSSESDSFRQRPAVIQTQLSAVITSVSQTELPSGAYESVVKAAPIVRVWCSVPVEPVDLGDSPQVAPRPLPRGGVNPYTSDPDDVGKLPPAINVQVTQKNTTAIDSTDGPIYDLGASWGSLGVPGAAAAPPPITKLAAPLLKAPKKKDSE